MKKLLIPCVPPAAVIERARPTIVPKPVEPRAAQPPGAATSIQAKIVYAGTKPFTGTATRPAWSIGLRKEVVRQYNDENQTNYSHSDLNLIKKGLDRVHTVPFSSLQKWIVDFLNNDLATQTFKDLTDGVFNQPSSQYTQMATVRANLLSATTPADKERLGNALLAKLHNSTANVRLGFAKPNRSLGDHLDPHTVETTSGQSFTPRSRHAVSTGIKFPTQAPKLKFTPKKGNFNNSQTKSGKTNVGILSPGSKNLASQHK